MLFHIPDFRVLSYEKPVDTVVFRILGTAVVDAAARDDQHIAVITHVKIIVDRLFDSTLAQHYRNMNTFVFCARSDENIDAADVLLRHDIHVCRGVSLRHFAVGADIVRAFRHPVKVSDFLKQF